MARRKVQLWRWVDEHDQPVSEIPAGRLHHLLTRQTVASVDRSHQHAVDYRSQVDAAPTSPHLVIHRLRDSDLPSERRNGQVVPLDKNVAELAETSHALLQPRNLVVFLGSGFSPRPSRLADWIRARVGWDVWLAPVVRPDLGTVLDNVRKVSNVELSIRADEARRLDMTGFYEGDNDPLRALDFAQRVQQGGIINIGWSVGQGSGADQGFFRGLFERLSRADTRAFQKAKAKVYVEDDDAAIPVDFIHDRIATEVEVDDHATRQRDLPAGTAHRAMSDAWDHFRDSENVYEIVDRPVGSPFTTPDALLDHNTP